MSRARPAPVCLTAAELQAVLDALSLLDAGAAPDWWSKRKLAAVERAERKLVAARR